MVDEKNLLNDDELEDVNGGFCQPTAPKAMHACGNGQKGQLKPIPMAYTHGSKQHYECLNCHKKGIMFTLRGEPGLCDLRSE